MTSLKDYKAKRTFSKTPEPTGGTPSNAGLKFVVQKHAASHLHYDFRLEVGGILKSWAVPKGPSMDPGVKRLAMMVEDHPFDYRTFEGIIPQGNYGAGTVMVWDEGTYEPVDTDANDKKAQEKFVRHQLYSGKLKFKLRGKKLKGEFAIVKAKQRGENSWLLMKLNDKYATDKDILLKNRSVVSRKTIESIARTSTKIWGQPESNSSKRTIKRSRGKALNSNRRLVKVVKKPKPDKAFQKLTTKLKPMLATLVDKPFHEEGWAYEVKWDGYRALAFVQPGVVELRSRNDKSFNEKFYPIYNSLSRWNISAVIDGEIVVVNKKGLSDFGALQNWRSEADGQLIYYVFDILWLDGKDLTQKTLLQRKEILKKIIPKSEDIRISEIFESTGTKFYDIAGRMGLEGIMAKKANSLYYAGERTKEWLKIKINKRQEVIIGGYTQNENSNKAFSSLLVGVYEGKNLHYIGKIGTGFTRSTQSQLMQHFKDRVSPSCPFDIEPDVNKPSRFRPNPPKAKVTWLKPDLVCEVSYVEMTSDGVMRHPTFEGMRIDKQAKDISFEKAQSTNRVIDKTNLVEGKLIMSPGKRDRKTLLNPTDETQVREINGHELKFTNLSKIYWPKERVSKRDMINYYYQVAPYILPYLKDRPQSLNRYPDGINGKSFYQKDVTGKVPPWVKTSMYRTSDEDTDKHFLVPEEEAAVLLMASMGCIELNPWSSTIQKPDHPDWCIIDLDPDKNSFDQVVAAAQVTKDVLDSFKISSYCKTSGSTGLHIYIPLEAKYTYEQSKEFGRFIATLVHREIPKYTSIERKVADRSGKMYIDFLQNRPKATLAAPYSLRPKPGAPVSMPLHWGEVKKGISITDFNIFNALDRLKSEGDIFKPVLGKGANLQKIIDKLNI